MLPKSFILLIIFLVREIYILLNILKRYSNVGLHRGRQRVKKATKTNFCQPRGTNERNFRSSLITLMTRRIHENSRVIPIKFEGTGHFFLLNSAQRRN